VPALIAFATCPLVNPARKPGRRICFDPDCALDAVNIHLRNTGRMEMRWATAVEAYLYRSPSVSVSDIKRAGKPLIVWVVLLKVGGLGRSIAICRLRAGSRPARRRRVCDALAQNKLKSQ